MRTSDPHAENPRTLPPSPFRVAHGRAFGFHFVSVSDDCAILFRSAGAAAQRFRGDRG